MKNYLRYILPASLVLLLFAFYSIAANLQSWQSPTTGANVAAIDTSGNLTLSGSVSATSMTVSSTSLSTSGTGAITAGGVLSGASITTSGAFSVTGSGVLSMSYGSLAANGTTTASTALITKQVTLLTSAGTSAVACHLPAPAVAWEGGGVVLVNTSTNTLTIFPAASESVSGGTSTTLAASKSARFYTESSNWYGP